MRNPYPIEIRARLGASFVSEYAQPALLSKKENKASSQGVLAESTAGEFASGQIAILKNHTLRSKLCVAEYRLDSQSLPDVTSTLTFAERIRTHLMGAHRRILGGDPASVSPLFSGKSTSGGPAEGHSHIFIWPMDIDKDGAIDRMVIKAARAFDITELMALDRLHSIRQENGRPAVKVELISFSATLQTTSASCWVSATPFVTSRHHRKGRGTYQEWLAGEIKRECAIHGLPEPERIDFIDHSAGKGHSLRWMEFVRSRKGRRPLQGHGCWLIFRETTNGPFALGALCHFGLGLFVPGGE